MPRNISDEEETFEKRDLQGIGKAQSENKRQKRGKNRNGASQPFRKRKSDMGTSPAKFAERKGQAGGIQSTRVRIHGKSRAAKGDG